MPELTIGKKIRELASHSLIYGLGSVLQSSLAIVLVPLYTRQLSIVDYGIFSICILFALLVGNMCSLGISSSLARSYFDHQDDQHKKKVIGTSLTLAGLCFSFQVALALLLASNFSSVLFGTEVYANSLLLALFWSSFTSLNNIFFVILRFKKMSTEVVLVNLFGLISSIIIIYGACSFITIGYFRRSPRYVY